MEPLVSVVMPAYNGEKYISESIESILNQTYHNFELIIIDDKSTDNTLHTIQKYTDKRIHLYKNICNKGIAYSTNLGIDNSKGKYIALLDDDDIALKKRLELQVDFMEMHNDIDILGGRSAMIDKDGKFLRYDKEPIYNSNYIKANLLFYNKKFANGTTMIRKNFIVENNLKYQEHCLGMQDFKFFIDSSKIGRLTSIDNLIHLKRIHEEQETVRSMDLHADKRAELHAQFQRESLKKSGFQLDERHLQSINDIMTEWPKKTYSKNDAVRLYQAFNEIVKQARKMTISYLVELEYACKKILGERVLTRLDIFGQDDGKKGDFIWNADISNRSSV